MPVTIPVRFSVSFLTFKRLTVVFQPDCQTLSPFVPQESFSELNRKDSRRRCCFVVFSFLSKWHKSHPRFAQLRADRNWSTDGGPRGQWRSQGGGGWRGYAIVEGLSKWDNSTDLTCFRPVIKLGPAAQFVKRRTADGGSLAWGVGDAAALDS